MFTGMISRPSILVLVGLTFAVGAGWGAYELRRERAADAADAAPNATEARTLEAAADTGTALEVPAVVTPTTETAPPAAVAETAHQDATDTDPAIEPSAPASSSVAIPADKTPDVAALEVQEAAEPIPPEAAAAPVAEPAPIAPPATTEAPADLPGSLATPAEAHTRLPAIEGAPETGAPQSDEAPAEAAPPPDERDTAALASPVAATEGWSDPADREDPSAIEPEAAPSFDVVRIQPGGAAVIAGRAAPDAEVELRSGDQVIDRVRADRRGEWVAIPQEPLPAGDQQLTLAARVGDRPAVESDEMLVIAVPEPPPPQPAPRAAAEPPPPQEIPAAQSPGEALAVALPRAARGQGRILQAPGRISGDGTLALIVLDYDTTGRIRLRGEASPGASVRIYVDNEPAGAAVVEPSGQWSTVLEPTLAPGDYTLRLDQLGSSGKPTARLETPFTRASQPPVEGDVQVDFVIVQPGNSLWRIARRVLGEGTHYVYIYDANQQQIRDPDLIYPGQVFEIPAGIGRAG